MTEQNEFTRLHHIYMEHSFVREEFDASGRTEYKLIAGNYYLLPYMVAKDMITLGKARESTVEEVFRHTAQNPAMHFGNEEL